MRNTQISIHLPKVPLKHLTNERTTVCEKESLEKLWKQIVEQIPGRPIWIRIAKLLAEDSNSKGPILITVARTNSHGNFIKKRGNMFEGHYSEPLYLAIARRHKESIETVLEIILHQIKESLRGEPRKGDFRKILDVVEKACHKLDDTFEFTDDEELKIDAFEKLWPPKKVTSEY